MTILPPPALQLALDGDTDVIIRRSFAHPPARVWRALTDPALIPQWMSSHDTMMRCQIDLRPGGSFRYDWEKFHFAGPILAVDAPHHLTQIEYFNGDTVTGSTTSIDLQAQGTGTRLTMVKRFASADARAQAIDIGMTDGFDEVFDRLDGLAIPD